MKIKQKLLLGMGLLFGMIVLLSAIAGFYINRLSDETKKYPWWPITIRWITAGKC